MEMIRKLKRIIRKHPVLLKLIQPPTLYATMAMRRFRRRNWYSKRGIMTEQQASMWISERILLGKPAAMGKLGTLELEMLIHDEPHTRMRIPARGTHEQHSDRIRQPIPTELKNLAFANVGLFPPEDKVIWRFLEELRAILSEVDAQAVWGINGERNLVSRYSANCEVLTVTGAFEPWRRVKPWSSSLRNKQVLVIHPFADTIESQFERARDQIWRGHPSVLPEFALRTLRMPLSAALAEPEESDWHERLSKLQARMNQIPFDVALIGAGGMSLPLAVHAKRLGRIGIHMGGSTQILFGIRGRRYDSDPLLQNFFNPSWVRPSVHETPSKAVQAMSRGQLEPVAV
jgi:hypothetical protein